MSTKKPKSDGPRATEPAAPPVLSPAVKIAASVAIALHLLAVFTAPWAMPPHGSQLARAVSSCIGPYIQAACMDNGYRFFAPEPGPGHLVRYEIVAGDGREIEGFFPDAASHRPRLLYHRYFMMSEFLDSLNRPDAAVLSDKFAESYVNHLADKYSARSIKLYLRQHRLPTAEEVRGGMKLGDPSLYDEKLVTDWTP